MADIENFYDLLSNLITVKNLVALGSFLKKCLLLSPLVTYMAIHYFLENDFSITSDRLGYYIGYAIGIIIELIVETILTGGATTVEQAVKLVFNQLKMIVQKLSKKVISFSDNIIEGIITVYAKLKHLFKNFPQFLDDLFELVLNWVRKLEDFMAIFSKETLALFSKHGVDISKVPPAALYTGIPIPVGNNVYALMRDGKEIFRGSKKEIENVASHLKTLKEAEVLKYLDELIDIKQIDEAIKKLNINITIPKNTLNYADSIKKIEGIISLIKNRKPPKHFDPDKDALKVLGIKLKPSKRGLCADFNGTKYLYPAKGNEKNIVKIKLTGSRKSDKNLAYEISNIKPNKNYTWHHLDDYDPITNTCTMQLVERKIHESTYPHFGGVKLIEDLFKIIYKN